MTALMSASMPVSMPEPARSNRGMPVVALFATLALHALVIGLALRMGGQGEPLPPPKPLTIEMIPSVPQTATAQGAQRAQTAESNPSRSTPIASAPASQPRPAAIPEAAAPPERGGELLTAVLSDEFAAPEPVPGDTADDRSSSVRAETGDAPTADPVVAGPTDRADTLPAVAPEPIEPFTAQGRWRYRVFFGEFSSNNQVALLDYVLDIEKGRYRLHTEGQAVGLLALLYRGVFTQESEGTFDAAGFGTTRYAERRGDRPARNVRIERQPESVRIAFDDGRTDDTPISGRVMSAACSTVA